MKTFVAFVVALAISAVVFLLLDIALFNAQGISFMYKG